MPVNSTRRQQILEALAQMLEQSPGERITTAKLAEAVGVSEAALYRHFPSKAKMYEGLIQFVEESVFSRVNAITSEGGPAIQVVDRILVLMLTFAERNPGISRILNGDALAGETDRLRQRVAQFYERLELEIKQVLRQAEIRENLLTTIPVSQAANLLLAAAEGRIGQFVRSSFERKPTEAWDSQWLLLSAGLLRESSAAATG